MFSAHSFAEKGMKILAVELSPSLSLEVPLKAAKLKMKRVLPADAFNSVANLKSGFEIKAKKLENFSGLPSVEADLAKTEEGRYKIDPKKDITVQTHKWGKLFSYITPTKGARFYSYIAPSDSSIALVLVDSEGMSSGDFKNIKVIK